MEAGGTDPSIDLKTRSLLKISEVTNFISNKVNMINIKLTNSRSSVPLISTFTISHNPKST
jgi:hypothetical protein